MSPKRTTADPGSVSHGTLRSEDLIPCFLLVLDSLREERSLSADRDPEQNGREDDVLGEIEARMRALDYYESEEAHWDTEAIVELLEQFAPDGHYFGAHQGDGADFGFWPIMPDEPEDDDPRELRCVTRFGRELRAWDDGSGPLWLYVESLGARGIVRADTWETAYECAVDEIMDDADPEDASTWARDYAASAAEGELAEGCHFRSNGAPSNPALSSPIASSDLNGSQLIRVTKEVLDSHELRVTWRAEK